MGLRMLICRSAVWLLICLMLAIGISVSAPTDAQIREAIGMLLEKGPAKMLGTEGHGRGPDQIDKGLSEFYVSRQLRPVWVSESGPGDRAEIALSFLDECLEEGLRPENYRVDLLHSFWNERDAESLAKLDILLTLELAHYVADVREGRLVPREVDPRLFASARDKEVDLRALARSAIASADLRSFIEEQSPQHRHYRSLIPALARYRKIAQSGGWPAIPQGPTLKRGMTDPRIQFVRKRLSITGEYTDPDLTSTTFDEPLERAVKLFQERHFLTPDGAIGKKTLAAMVVSAEERVRQIIVNMERWRWTSRKMEGRQIFVNIASYQLAATLGEDIEISMPVIVGREYHMTPVFSHEIEYAEFNPFWNVPASIAGNEYLPQLRKDPNVLRGKHIRIFAGYDEDAAEVDPTSVDWKKVTNSGMNKYRLRQDPGPWNALGTVKFIFPNQYNVYLHDTPNHALFEREKRTMSHGCIRVSRPHELAAQILGSEDERWTIDRAKEAVQSNKRQIVNLETPMPVHILYRTAVVRDDGAVYFGEDIYGRDKLLEKALFQ